MCRSKKQLCRVLTCHILYILVVTLWHLTGNKLVDCIIQPVNSRYVCACDGEYDHTLCSYLWLFNEAASNWMWKEATVIKLDIYNLQTFARKVWGKLRERNLECFLSGFESSTSRIQASLLGSICAVTLLRDGVPKMCIAADEAGPCNNKFWNKNLHVSVFLYEVTGSAFAPTG